MSNEKMSIDEIEGRADQLVDAQTKINEAIYLIRSAVQGTDEEARAEAYILSALAIWASDDGKSSSYTDCDSLLERIENPEDDDPPEIDEDEAAHLQETEDQDPGGYDESTNPSSGWAAPESK